MPLFDVALDNGDVLTVEHPQAPTPEEAQALIATIPRQQTEREVFEQEFIAESQAPFLQQVGGLAGQVGEMVAAPFRTVGRGVQELGTVIGEASVAPEQPKNLSEFIASRLPPGFATTVRALPTLAQTGLETGGRTALSLGSLIRQAVEGSAERPLEGLAGPAASLLSSLRPRTPTPEEVSDAFVAQQAAQNLATVRSTPIVPEVFGEANVPIAEAGEVLLTTAPGAPAALGATARAVEATGSGLARAATFPSRALARVTPTVEQSAMSSLGLSSAEVQEIIPIAVPRIAKTAGKVPATADEILKVTPKTRQALFNEATEGLGVAQKEGLTIKGTSAVDDAIAAIESDTRFMADNPEEATRLIKKYDKYREELDPLKGRQLLEDTNKGLKSHYNKTAKGQASDMTDAELRAEKAFALNLGDQVDDLVKFGSGKDISPYRDIGKIIEFERALDISNEGAKQAFATRVAPISQRGRSLPQGRVEAVRRAGRAATTAFRNTEVENLDKQLGNVFKGTPKRVSQPKFPTDARSAIGQRYVKGRARLEPPVIIESTPITQAAPTTTFSPSTLKGLQEFGITPDSPYWNTVGEQLESSVATVRSRALLGETINR